jgi:hypothetical protein
MVNRCLACTGAVVAIIIIQSILPALIDVLVDRMADSLEIEQKKRRDQAEKAPDEAPVRRHAPAAEEPAYDPALAQQLLERSLKGDVAAVRSILSHPKLNINADVSHHGPVLFQLCSKPETEASKEIVRLLLTHPKINPNGLSTAWTPLKAALRNNNQAIMRHILEHERTVPQVTVDGLDCSVVDFTPRRIAFVVSWTNPRHECFKSHSGKVLKDTDADVVDLRTVQGVDGEPGKPKTVRVAARQTGAKPAAAARDAATSSQASGKSAAGGAVTKAIRPTPAPAVVSPEEFGSFAEVASYYFFSRWWPYWNLIIAAIGAESALLAFAVFCGASAVRREQRAARAAAEVTAEIRAAITPQRTPQVAPVVPQPVEVPPVALPPVVADNPAADAAVPAAAAGGVPPRAAADDSDSSGSD